MHTEGEGKGDDMRPPWQILVKLVNKNAFRSNLGILSKKQTFGLDFGKKFELPPCRIFELDRHPQLTRPPFIFNKVFVKILFKCPN
jgi:hypothetical protein